MIFNIHLLDDDVEPYGIFLALAFGLCLAYLDLAVGRGLVILILLLSSFIIKSSFSFCKKMLIMLKMMFILVIYWSFLLFRCMEQKVRGNKIVMS